MNTRKEIQPPTKDSVISVSYSSSGKRFIAGLHSGFKVFRADNCLVTYEPDFSLRGGASIAEILDDRYLAYVCAHKTSHGSPSTVVFWDVRLERELSKFDFHEPVKGFRLTSEWMAVILEARTVVFQYQELRQDQPLTLRPENSSQRESIDLVAPDKMRAPNLVHSLHPTTSNHFGLGCLQGNYLLLPASGAGQVQLVSLKTQGSSSRRVLRAHNSSIRCLGLSKDGSLLATASEQGTLVRVYDTQSLDQVAELRRGVDHATIYSLAFSCGNRWIASTSDKGTLHVFDLRPSPPGQDPVMVRARESRENAHRKSQSYATRHLSTTGAEKESLSGMSAGRSSPAPSTAVGTGIGRGYYGSVQEYYGLRPPPISASPPARDAAVSAMAALKASPFAPRIFKDVRSVASSPFHIGKDPPNWQGGASHSWTTAPNGTQKRVKNPVPSLPNDPLGKPPKGILRIVTSTQTSDDDGVTMYVVGGGNDCRWELFELLPAAQVEGATGDWVLVNRGFRKYLTRQFAD